MQVDFFFFLETAADGVRRTGLVRIVAVLTYAQCNRPAAAIAAPGRTVMDFRQKRTYRVIVVGVLPAPRTLNERRWCVPSGGRGRFTGALGCRG